MVTVHALQAAMILLPIWIAPRKIGGIVRSRSTHSVNAAQMLDPRASGSDRHVGQG
jgi:hypothetical protein